MLVELENVKGLKELQDALYQLPVNIAKNVLRGSVLAGALRQRIGHGHRAHRVIGEAGLGVEQRCKVFAFEVAEFVGRTNDVADDGAEHVQSANSFMRPTVWLSACATEVSFVV
jgi:hypothetical protein